LKRKELENLINKTNKLIIYIYIYIHTCGAIRSPHFERKGVKGIAFHTKEKEKENSNVGRLAPHIS
jgi:hypothetical protein